MAITISGENNNDKILASDGVIDQLSGFSIVGVITATSFTGDVTGNLTGNVTGNINNSTLLLQTGSTERVRIDSGGRVGLGINNPGSYFSSYNRVVMGRTNDTGGMTIVSAPTSGGYIAFADGTSGNEAYRGRISYYHSADAMAFNTAATEKFRITSGGNIGIGTATIRNNRTVQITGASQSNLLITGNAPSICLNADADDSTDNDRTFLGQAIGSNNFANGTAAGDTILRGNSSGRIVFGIGTAIKMNLTSAGDLNIGTVGRFDASGLVKSAHGTESAPSHTFLNDPDNGMYRPTTNTLGFVTGGTEKLRITSGGSVNIATTSSRLSQTTFKSQIETGTNKLISFGDAEGSQSDKGSAIIFSRPSNGAEKICAIFQHTNQSLGIAARDDFTVSTGGNAFYYSATERLRINSAGALLLGTPTHSNLENLHVHTASSDKAIIKFTNTGTGTGTGDGFEFGLNSAEQIEFFNKENTDMFFGTNNTERLRITSSGDVGIGKDSPAGKLHISSGNSGDCVLIIEADEDNNNESDNPRIEFRQDGGVAVSAIGHGLLSGQQNGLVLANGVSTGYISFATGTVDGHVNAIEKLRIESSGEIRLTSENGNNSDTPGFTFRGGSSSQKANFARIHSRMVSNWGGQLQFKVKNDNGSLSDAYQTAMIMDHNGHVTKPNNPSFRVNRTVGNNYTSTTGEILPWDLVEWDKTNVSGYGYNTSTYKYRVAVAGVYWFHCSVYTDANVDVMFDIVKNNNSGYIQRAELRQSGADDIGNNTIVHCAGLSQCAVGDYIYCYNSGTTNIELIGGGAEGYVDFSGYLIG